MYKEAYRIPFLHTCLLSGSWYVFQQRVHYQAFLKHEYSVIDIKLVMIVTIKPLLSMEALFT